MKLIACALFVAFAGTLFAADTSGLTVAKAQDQMLSSLERELVPLAEAMPAAEYDFAPTAGEFKGVRTFSQQISHVATVLYTVSSAVLGEKCPIDPGKEENGPASLKGKDAVVKYLKDSFGYAHRASLTLTTSNLTDPIVAPFGPKIARIALVELLVSHSFDHFGQAVVYARMNGVVPPSSRGR
jgi:uncharacterized damage-inducible protein DinB